MTDDLLTVPQAAARVGLSRETVNRAVLAGRIPVAAEFGAGRVRLVRAADVDAWRAAPRSKGGRPRRADRDRPQDTTRRGQD